MILNINYVRVRVLMYMLLVFFYTLELLYEDFSEGTSSQTQFEMRQGFGFTLLSLSFAALFCCSARLDKMILLCDAALFAFTVARCLLVAFAGFDGEAVFLALNAVNICIFPMYDIFSALEALRQAPPMPEQDKIGQTQDTADGLADSAGGVQMQMQSHLPDEQLYEGFRVRVDRLPEVSSVPTDLLWSTFHGIEHRIDSSSCHIYTAFWGDRQVILKLIKADRISSPVAVAEFETEASVLCRLRHPHIVRFLGSGYQPRRFLVLELLDGGSLSHALGVRVDKDQRSWRKYFSFLDALRLARAMADGLDYLHSHWHESISIFHRDLKPDNIGFTCDGNIKIFDFGLCSVVRRQPGSQEEAEVFEMTGNTGTLRYMAPEVALAKPYNQSVDTYSFGIILWQIVKGKVPFSGLGRRTYMEHVVVGGERPRLDRSWPKAFSRLLQRCWNEDRTQRPSFAEVTRELDALILTEEASTKYRLLRVLNSPFGGENTEKLGRFHVCFLLLFAVFLASSIALCLVNKSEITGISSTVVSAFGFYVLAISCIRVRPRRPQEGGSGGYQQSFNPLQQQSAAEARGGAGEQKKLHGIDFIQT
jgi:serine/threonine protein kinase